jgi:hypothetical protein
MAKATKREVTARVQQVYTMLVSGIDTAQILQYASENWQIVDRNTYNYIARANKLIAKHAETHREHEMGKAVARLNRLYSSALKVQDYKTCLAVQKEINALFGLYAPTKTDVTSNGEPISVVFSAIPAREKPPTNGSTSE